MQLDVEAVLLGLHNVPPGASVLVNAVDWLEGTLLGTLATTVAIIAVGAIGFLMLTGRADWRRSANVLCGCFILFGAPNIVAGFQAMRVGDEGAPITGAPMKASALADLPPQWDKVGSGAYDPYAGASVSRR